MPETPEGATPESRVERLLAFNRICDSFEAAWKNRAAPRLEDFLRDFPAADRARLFRELLQVELHYRKVQGQRPTKEEYEARFEDRGDVVAAAFGEMSAPDEQPKAIGGYEIQRFLGSGSFGRVYLAFQRLLRRPVAIKILSPSRRFRNEVREVLSQYREGRLWAGLKHRNIVAVHAAGEDEQYGYYLVLEHIDGKSLDKALVGKAESRRFSPVEASRLIADIAEAIAYAHAAGVIHRDLKPANILVDEEGEPHVTDFGLAVHSFSSSWREGELAGSPAYMAPEQWEGKIDPQSDVWSLGVILFELLTGARPFSVGSKAELLEAHDRFDVPEEVPSDLRQVVRRCLRVKSAPPYGSARELADELRTIYRRGRRSPETLHFGRRSITFHDRPWLFSELERWTNRATGQILLITGDPGTGKTEFLYELRRRNPNGRVLAWHYCERDRLETLDASRFVGSLAAMLRENCPECRDAFSSSSLADALNPSRSDSAPASAFANVILAPLASVGWRPDEVRYLLVDALDESRTATCSCGTVLDVLAYAVDRLPPWLRIIATTRSDPEVLQRFSGTSSIRIDGSDGQYRDAIRDDLWRFVAARVEEHDLAERLRQASTPKDHLIESLVEKSELNYQYVVQALQGIERGLYQFDALDELPPGLCRLYSEYLRRLFPDEERFSTARKVFEVLLVAREPVSLQLLAQATGLDVDYDLPSLMRRTEVYAPADTHAGVTTYRLFNSAFADWLSDRQAAGAFYASPKLGHRRLAGACWREYEQAALSPYGLRHLPDHTLLCAKAGVDAGDIGEARKALDRLVHILVDLDFIGESCCAGNYSGLVSVYNSTVAAITDELAQDLAQTAPWEGLAGWERDCIGDVLNAPSVCTRHMDRGSGRLLRTLRLVPAADRRKRITSLAERPLSQERTPGRSTDSQDALPVTETDRGPSGQHAIFLLQHWSRCHEQREPPVAGLWGNVCETATLDQLREFAAFLANSAGPLTHEESDPASIALSYSEGGPIVAAARQILGQEPNKIRIVAEQFSRTTAVRAWRVLGRRFGETPARETVFVMPSSTDYWPHLRTGDEVDVSWVDLASPRLISDTSRAGCSTGHDITPDGGLEARPCTEGVQIWDRDRHIFVRLLQSELGSPRGVSLSFDGTKVAGWFSGPHRSDGDSWRTVFWDLRSGECIRSANGVWQFVGGPDRCQRVAGDPLAARRARKHIGRLESHFPRLWQETDGTIHANSGRDDRETAVYVPDSPIAETSWVGADGRFCCISQDERVHLLRILGVDDRPMIVEAFPRLSFAIDTSLMLEPSVPISRKTEELPTTLSNPSAQCPWCGGWMFCPEGTAVMNTACEKCREPLKLFVLHGMFESPLESGGSKP